MAYVNINLIGDFQAKLVNKGILLGLKLQNLDSSLASIRVLTYLRKTGNSLPKKIIKSKDFDKSIPLELADNVHSLIKKIEKGVDLTPYLSKNSIILNNDKKFDYLFNDWGILHLHLGKEFEDKKSKFIKRTGPLLFIIPYFDKVYLLSVFNHGDNVWSKKTLVQEVYDNWPELLYKSDDLVGLETEISDDERQLLRKAGINSPIIDIKDSKTGEKIFVSMNWSGYCITGDPIVDIQYHDKIVKKLKKLQEIIKNRIYLSPAIYENYKEQTVVYLTLNFDLKKRRWQVMDLITENVFWEDYSDLLAILN